MSYPSIDSDRPGNSGAAAQGFHLAPLSTGQILDRVFVLYRSRFGLFAGLAVFPAAVSLLFGLAQLAFLLATHTPLNGSANQPFSTAYLVNMSIGLVGGLLKLCVYGISIAATTWCIAKIYLGEPATMKSGFDFGFRKWLRYIALVLTQYWFAGWLPGLVMIAAVVALAVTPLMLGPVANSIGGFLVVLVVLVDFVWIFIRFIRVSLAIPACVVEEIPIRASIGRSRALLVSRKGRIFLLFLLIFTLEMVVSAVLVPFAVYANRTGPTGLLIMQAASLAVAFAYGVLLSPIAAIGLCLFYFDERIRREGFDIEYLMSHSAGPISATAEASHVSSEVTPSSSEALPPAPETDPAQP